MSISYNDGVLTSVEGSADEAMMQPGDLSPQAERTAKLYDFYLDYTGAIQRNDYYTPSPAVGYIIGGSSTESANYVENTIQIGSNAQPESDNSDKNYPRINANPKDVLHELEQFPVAHMMVDLEEKISTLKDKTLMTNQRYASEQINALVKRLENRRKYHEHEDFYKVFPNTNDEKIDNLLKKYKLVVKTIDIFVPTFPKEAIDVMKEYTRVTKEVCGEEPVYYVIAEESDFKEKFKKLDPILLVQSPFGFWWQVLGAWDKEMLLLCEL